MALIFCPICSNKVSEQAPACPHCGHPIARQTALSQPQKLVIEERKAGSSGFGVLSGGCLTFILILLVIVALAAVATKPTESALKNSLAAKYGWLFQVGSTLGQNLGLVNFAYHDYLFFSTLTIQVIGEPERTAAFGVFGQVITPGEIPQPRRSEVPKQSPADAPANTYIPGPPANTNFENETANTSNANVMNIPETGTTAQTCFVVNPSGGLVNLRRDCDRKDCSLDASTLYTEIDNASPVIVLNTGNAYSKGYVWVPVSHNGEVLWISATRLNQSCVPY